MIVWILTIVTILGLFGLNLTFKSVEKSLNARQLAATRQAQSKLRDHRAFKQFGEERIKADEAITKVKKYRYTLLILIILTQITLLIHELY